MRLRLVRAESTFAYMDALEGYLREHGRPLAFYSDKHSVFRIARPSQASGETRRGFGRALAELQIEIICADTSQAKGRALRANRTLQDRLVKALRLEGASAIEEGNAFRVSRRASTIASQGSPPSPTISTALWLVPPTGCARGSASRTSAR